VVNPPGGEVDGVRFVLDLDSVKVEDVWIDDLRTFPHPVLFQGKALDPKASIEQLELVFGKCTRVTGVKGGIYYNCQAGLALGTDFSHATLQIRVKPR
jgi:hypothetical protein